MLSSIYLINGYIKKSIAQRMEREGLSMPPLEKHKPQEDMTAQQQPDALTNNND